MNNTLGRFQRLRTWVTSPLSKATRGLLTAGGIVLPILCHASVYDGLPFRHARWQSGKLHDQVAFVLLPQAGFIFYPFMAFAMFALARYVWSDAAGRHRHWIGFGLINGTIISLWYIGIFAIVLTGQDRFDPASTARAIGGLGLLALIPLILWLIVAATKWGAARLGMSPAKAGIALTILYFVGFSVWSYLGDQGAGALSAIQASVLLPWILGIWFAPLWSLLTYSLVSLRWLAIDRRAKQFSLLQLMGLITYAAGLITACRLSVRLSFNAYLQLPLQQPSQCYVATAASRGHPRWVRAHTVRYDRDGRSHQINHQIQNLKGFEIALATLAPRWHRALRAAYNRFGPALARHIDNRWKADLAYLGLKPAEWFAQFLLYLLLGKRRSIIKRLYVDVGSPSR